MGCVPVQARGARDMDAQRIAILVPVGERRRNGVRRKRLPSMRALTAERFRVNLPNKKYAGVIVQTRTAGAMVTVKNPLFRRRKDTDEKSVIPSLRSDEAIQ
jgi:hypothetical protein